MTTLVIDDKKKGAQEMLNLLSALDFVTSFHPASKKDFVRMRSQKLIKYPEKYEPLALAGVAEDSPLDLAEIRKGWKKR
jgi:hypothetical protein